VGLREQQLELRSILEKELKYSVIESARNFQFEKAIPNSKERMRIEFMAPSELKRPGKDFRVDVQDSLHARSCTGGSIAIVESDLYTISGHLPNGESCSAKIRVTRPNALIMMKMLALDDRYRNARGPKELPHDREEARVHAADIIAIASAQVPIRSIRDRFEAQFHSDPPLGIEVLSISDRYFREDISPGFLVYEEYLRANLPVSSASRKELDTETQRAHAMMMDFLPPRQFYNFVLACENSCNMNTDATLVQSFLDALEARKISIQQLSALELLPGRAFNGMGEQQAEKSTSAIAKELRLLSELECQILHRYLQSRAAILQGDRDLCTKYPFALKQTGPLELVDTTRLQGSST
jgi:hypothetical protein